MQEYSNDLLDNLRRGAGKALQNLEALRIHCCDVPLPLFHPKLPEPQEFKPIHHLFVNNSDFRYLQYLDLDFMWGCQSPVDFIKIARACPYLETLSLGNWFHEPQQDICDSEENLDEEILRFRQILSLYLKVFDRENAREPLLPHIQEMQFINRRDPENVVQGLSEVLYDSLIKRIWPNVVFSGNNYKSV